MIPRTLLLIACYALCTPSAYTQDINYAREVIAAVCHPDFHGRGYVQKGDSLASEYIRAQLTRWNVQPFKNDFFQEFSMGVNTFPGKVSLAVGGVALTPGRDFIVSPDCPAVKGDYPVLVYDSSMVFDKKAAARFDKADKRGAVVLMDDKGMNEEQKKLFQKLVYSNPWNAAALIKVADKLTWGASSDEAPYPVFEILRTSLPAKKDKVSLHVENKYIAYYRTRNIIGYLEGTRQTDTFIVFTAHYDHLGRMGSATYFPGANDNGSGIAMLLNLAAHFSKPENRPAFNIAFIFFAGEEAGLLGSKYYASRPFFPLEKIRFLVNLDLVGTGDDGIQVVNSTVFTDDFSVMTTINDEKKLVQEIKTRGKAANSDHHWFTEKGVPSFFIYTLGGIKAYHDIDDKPETLPLTDFEDLFRLLVEFTQRL